MHKMKAVALFLIVLVGVPQLCVAEEIINSQFVVKHGEYSEVTFRASILSGHELNGLFKSSESIYVYVFDENGYNLFRQNGKAFALYNSGKTKESTMKMKIGKGRYWIIFDARHAIMIDRTVLAHFTLN